MNAYLYLTKVYKETKQYSFENANFAAFGDEDNSAFKQENIFIFTNSFGENLYIPEKF